MEEPMSRFACRERLLAGGVLIGIIGASLTAGVAAPSNAPPDFSANGWLNENTFQGGEMLPVEGSPPLFHQDPAHPFVANNSGAQPTYRIADLSNPNVKQWVKDAMKKDNDEVLASKIAFTARSSCMPAGVPGFDLFGFQPIFFLQTPKEVTMIYSGDQQVRRVYLNVPHSANPKPSWYGESVGHYEGDTLVIDTIGMNDKTFVDNYRTPHSERLHVVERWKMADDGKTLEVAMRIEDPDTYNRPWSAVQRYRRAQQEMLEEVCAENNQHLFDYHIPVADRPDF
jgi:hypothetical protein